MDPTKRPSRDISVLHELNRAMESSSIYGSFSRSRTRRSHAASELPLPLLVKKEPTENYEVQDAERAESLEVSLNYRSQVFLTDAPNARERRQIVKFFQPAWFAMTMGWGITGLIIDGFPQAGGTFREVLGWIGVVIWLWNAVYWFSFFGCLLSRLIAYPKGFLEMMKHPAQPMFLGCVPMGFATFVNGWINFGGRLGIPDEAAKVAHVLFWIDVVMSIASILIPTYFSFVYQTHTLDSMTSLWILPVVANVVAAASGALIGPKLHTIRLQRAIFFTCLCLWGSGVTVAACLIAVYYTRLIIGGLPAPLLGHSNWVVVGPLGQGANGILILGRTAYNMSLNNQLNDTPYLTNFSHVLAGVSILVGLTMWSLGMFWLVVASYTSIGYTEKWFFSKEITKRLTGRKAVDATESDLPVVGMPYTLGWWAVIFPLGTLTLATYQLATSTAMPFFVWMGRIFCCTLTVLSCYIHFKTVKRMIDGRIWQSMKPAPSTTIIK